MKRRDAGFPVHPGVIAGGLDNPVDDFGQASTIGLLQISRRQTVDMVLSIGSERGGQSRDIRVSRKQYSPSLLIAERCRGPSWTGNLRRRGFSPGRRWRRKW